MTDEYVFLQGDAHGWTKYTFPAPSYHRVFWHPEHSRAAYPTVDDFLCDVRGYIRQEVIERLISLGHDLHANLIPDAEINNSVFEGIRGVTRALHICRGNGPGGSWSAAGGYDILAPEMFPRLTNIDRLLLEYDTPRAGDFSPLRHVLPPTTVVLGLLTTKCGRPEDAATVERRIGDATRFIPLER